MPTDNRTPGTTAGALPGTLKVVPSRRARALRRKRHAYGFESMHHLLELGSHLRPSSRAH